MGDTEKFLVEDMVIYALVAFGSLTWDFWQNLFHTTGLRLESVPYSFGAYQAVVLLFCAIQFARNLSRWRYYRKV